MNLLNSLKGLVAQAEGRGLGAGETLELEHVAPLVGVVSQEEFDSKNATLKSVEAELAQYRARDASAAVAAEAKAGELKAQVRTEFEAMARNKVTPFHLTGDAGDEASVKNSVMAKYDTYASNPVALAAFVDGIKSMPDHKTAPGGGVKALLEFPNPESVAASKVDEKERREVLSQTPAGRKALEKMDKAA